MLAVPSANTSFSRWKIIEILLAIMLLIAPLYYHPNTGGEGLQIPDNITIWSVAVVIICYSLLRAVSSPVIKVPRRFILLAAFPILVTFTGVITGVEQPLAWAFRLLFIWGGLAFFFSLFQHRLKQGRSDRILFFIVLSALIYAVVGILQIHFKLDLPFWLPTSATATPSAYFQQINVQASYQATAIVIAFFLSVRPYVSHGRWWQKLLLIVAVGLAAYIIGISGSRVGSLGLFLAIPVISIALWRRFCLYKRLLLMLYLALITGFGSGLVVNQTAVDKVVAMQAGYSGSSRLGIYKIALDLVEKKPLFGYGIGSFGRVWQLAKPQLFQQHPNAELPAKFVNHPHNEILLWLVEAGSIALLAMLLLAAGVIITIKNSGRRGVALLAMLLPIVLHTQVELPFYMSALHWLVVMLLLFCLYRPTAVWRANNMTIYAKKLIKLCLYSTTTLLLLFFAHSLRSNWDFVQFYDDPQQAQPFSYAYKNPYLYQEAQSVYMNSLLYPSIQQNITANVQAYAQWAGKRLLERPDIYLYLRLTDAYQYLGDKTNYCKTAYAGLALYPQAARLATAKEFCQY